MSDYVLLEGKSEVVLKDFDDNSIDSVVTDPPYGLGDEPDIVEVMKDWIKQGYHEVKSKGGFMGKQWDSFVPQPLLWKEVFRVLKPGGYALVACGTRTQDWMVASLRFAGFEVRDVITWHYGTGFPKGLDISKAIDAKILIGSSNKKDFKKLEGEKGISKLGYVKNNHEHDFRPNNYNGQEYNKSVRLTSDEAKQWDGWGTALKPATEFWTLVRKPLSEKTVADNVLKYGTGGVNINGCRIGDNGGLGRFPANLILDEFAAQEVDSQSGILKSGTVSPEGFKGDYTSNIYGKYANNVIDPANVYGDSGGASRFFYVSKASGKERNAGCEHLPNGNNHPTVKPISLMRYLAKLITPKGGICVDPFVGSGSTGVGCVLEGIEFVGIDDDSNSILISEARMKYWKDQLK